MASEVYLYKPNRKVHILNDSGTKAKCGILCLLHRGWRMVGPSWRRVGIASVRQVNFYDWVIGQPRCERCRRIGETP